MTKERYGTRLPIHGEIKTISGERNPQPTYLVWNGEEHIGRQDLTCVSKKHSKGEQNRTGIIRLQNYSGLLF